MEQIEPEVVEVKVSRKEALAKKAIDEGGEINPIDATELTLDSDEIDNAVA